MLLHSFLCMERQRTGKRMKAPDGFVAFDYQICEKAVSGQLCERDVKQRILIEKSLTVSAPQGIQLLFAAKIQAVEVFGCNAAVLRQQVDGKRLQLYAHDRDIAYIPFRYLGYDHVFSVLHHDLLMLQTLQRCTERCAADAEL